MGISLRRTSIPTISGHLITKDINTRVSVLSSFSGDKHMFTAALSCSSHLMCGVHTSNCSGMTLMSCAAPYFSCCHPMPQGFLLCHQRRQCSTENSNSNDQKNQDWDNELIELRNALQSPDSIKDITMEQKMKWRELIRRAEPDNGDNNVYDFDKAFEGDTQMINNTLGLINSVLAKNKAPPLKGFYGVRVKTLDSGTRDDVVRRHVNAASKYIYPKTDVDPKSLGLEQNIVICGESGSGKTTMAICHPWFGKDRNGVAVIYFGRESHNVAIGRIKKASCEGKEGNEKKEARNVAVAKYVTEAVRDLLDVYYKFVFVFDEIGYSDDVDYVRGILAHDWTDTVKEYINNSRIACKKVDSLRARAILVGNGLQLLVGSHGAKYTTVRMTPWTNAELAQL